MAWFNIFSFIVQTITSIPSALASTKELTSKHPHGTAGAEQAYADFMGSATTVIYRFRLVAELGVPPSIKGGLWTFPVVFRSNQILTDATEQLLASIGRIALFGSTEALNEAKRLSDAIAEIGGKWPSQRWPARVPELIDAMEQASTCLGDFARVIRNELGDQDAAP